MFKRKGFHYNSAPPADEPASVVANIVAPPVIQFGVLEEPSETLLSKVAEIHVKSRDSSCQVMVQKPDAWTRLTSFFVVTDPDGSATGRLVPMALSGVPLLAASQYADVNLDEVVTHVHKKMLFHKDEDADYDDFMSKAYQFAVHQSRPLVEFL